ncbi:hypothetical protein FQN54_009019 [Arachnomyces sp. PD_36]|nr:hypothetical protein FQN54_009019 [Arachnomyces sp. PD_36]
MPFQSRWEVPIPDTSLPSLIFTSPTHPLSKTHRSFSDASRPETHYLTTHSFRLWSQRFAAGLKRSGLQDGDRVLLFSGNDLFFPVVFMGIVMAGGIFTGANPTYVARELAHQLRDSEARYLICADSQMETGIEAAEMVNMGSERIFVFNGELMDGGGKGSHGCAHWGDLVGSVADGERFVWDPLSAPGESDKTIALNYSSGTTGLPKGVEISHRNYVSNVIQYLHGASLDPHYGEKLKSARWLCFLPMYHAMAQNIFIAGALMRNTPVYIMSKFDFIQMLESIQKFRITDLILVPPILVALAKHPAVKKYDLSSVENIGSGAAPLGREVSEEVEKLWEPGKINVKQGWGMTETTCSILGWGPNEKSFSFSVGELNANCEAKIMAEDGKTELGRNARGELWVRAPNIMKGYWRNPRATRETLTKDRWLKTGDICYVDEYGKFFIVDRKKELIKVKGNQVAPAELEALLLEHPGVADAAVIGITINNDEAPRAYIVPKPNQTPSGEEIAKFISGKVSATKRITGGVVFIDSIPKNPSGKILRKVLRDRAAQEQRKAQNTSKL